jgi:hypothetical protein
MKTIMMIEPVSFGFNEETAANNYFQQNANIEDAQTKALKEFQQFVDRISSHDIDVLVVKDTPSPVTPDSIFPNNWISIHEEGTMVLYPMFAKNRRMERKQTVIDAVKQTLPIKEVVDFTHFENSRQYLEGTGSMVLDRKNKIAYACISERTDKELFASFCMKMNYTPILFHAHDQRGLMIYHTNVLMCMADQYVVICLDTVYDKVEKEKLIDQFKSTQKEIITISFDQMNHFCGNMLQVKNKQGNNFLVMSTQAYQHLTPEQVNRLETYQPIIHSDITTIETLGGGSARCMMAELV